MVAVPFRRALPAVALLLSLVGATLWQPAAAAAATAGAWQATGSLAHARYFAPAVRLTDGSVLVAGGSDNAMSVAAAERWSSGSGTWTAAGSLPAAVAGQVAALLPDGRALFAGGTTATDAYLFGDVYDPGTSSWAHTGQMAHAHLYGAAASLANGDVLVVGGSDDSGAATATVDRYAVSGATWSAAAALPDGKGRVGLTATALADGRVLVAGGDDWTASTTSTLATAAIFNSTAGTWQAAESMTTARWDHAAIRLKDGQVLVAGGSDAAGKVLGSTELYNPATGHWTAGRAMVTARAGLTLSLLADGRVLAAGGYATGQTPLASAEIFDPSTGVWAATGSLASARAYHSATALTDGRVLVAGGEGSAGGPLATSELYTPPAPPGALPAMTYHPITQTRILDTRSGLGLSGMFTHRVPRSFQVTGRGGVPTAATAKVAAVSGIVTITGQNYAGYLTIDATLTGSPGRATLQFLAGDERAVGVSVPLSASGQLAIVIVGPPTSLSANVFFDVTGYFTADTTGGTYVPLQTPTRVMDSYRSVGLTGTFANRVPRTFAVATATSGVPADAIAVTGTFVVNRQTTKGYAFVGAAAPADVTKVSSLSVKYGETRANGVTVKLGTGGTLTAVWVGATGSSAHLLFDVTGYYVAGTSGARFYPVPSVRLMDTRYALPFQGPIAAQKPYTLAVVGKAGVPSSAIAITGIVQVTRETKTGYLAVGRHITAATAWPTMNFPVGVLCTNDFHAGLWTDGTVSFLYYASPLPATTDVLLDVTGYFAP